MYIKKKYRERVHYIEHDSDGWWIYLKGYYWDDKGLHTIHEDTLAEAVQQLYYTDKCNCDYCKGLEK